MKNFCTHANRIADVFSGDRHDHEFLDIYRVIRMFAAIKNIHHGHRQHPCGCATDVAIQRLAAIVRSGFGDGQGDPQNRIGAQARFVGRAVHFDHGLVDCDLFIGFKANQRICNFSVHIFNRCQHTFALIAIFIAIAQLNGLISTG